MAGQRHKALKLYYTVQLVSLTVGVVYEVMKPHEQHNIHCEIKRTQTPPPLHVFAYI